MVTADLKADFQNDIEEEDDRADQPLMAPDCRVAPLHWPSRRRRRLLMPKAEAAPNTGKGPGTGATGVNFSVLEEELLKSLLSAYASVTFVQRLPAPGPAAGGVTSVDHRFEFFKRRQALMAGVNVMPQKVAHQGIHGVGTTSAVVKVPEAESEL